MTTDRVLDARAALDAARSERSAAERAQAEGPQLVDLFADPDPLGDWTNPRSPTQEWTEDAVAALHDLALSRETFTVDAVLSRVGSTYDKRAVGAVLRVGHRQHWISADVWVAGGPERHGRPIRLWRSLLWRPPA